MKNIDLRLLFQLIEATNDSVNKLEGAFRNKDAEKFRKTREEILNLQKKVYEELK